MREVEVDVARQRQRQVVERQVLDAHRHRLVELPGRDGDLHAAGRLQHRTGAVDLHPLRAVGQHLRRCHRDGELRRA